MWAPAQGSSRSLPVVSARVGFMRSNEGGPLSRRRPLRLKAPSANALSFWKAAPRQSISPERVDVIVTETLWNFGLGEGLLGAIVDARDRFLKDGGRIVPRSLEMHCSLVESPGALSTAREHLGCAHQRCRLSSLRSFATNNVYVATFSQADLLSEPIALAKVSLLEARQPDVMAEVTCQVTRSGAAHGIAGWFRAELSDHVALSNAPPVSTSSWDHAFSRSRSRSSSRPDRT